MDRVLAIILAGGRGERLSILAQERAKPALPFAGKYRIIDFTMSNCANSGVRNLFLLTQYQPMSLLEHIGIGAPWDFDRQGCLMRVVQAHLASSRRGWYKGNADAVYQNLQYIEEVGAELVLILSGDHVYKMDYSRMLKFHEETQADVTLAVTRLPGENLQQFGTVQVDETGQVTNFREKSKAPKSNLVSMGVYLFKKDVLQLWLEEDARSMTSRHDFGKNILPRIVGKARIFAYDFDGYWRDVGTVQNYWQANMEMLEISLGLLSDADWTIHTKEEERPPAVVSETAEVVNSWLSDGCIIEGSVEHSLLSPGVRVAEGAVVKDSVILSDSIIGSHSTIDHSILDKEVVVASGCYIGFGDDFRVNHSKPRVLNNGITIIGKKAKLPAEAKIGRNCVIHCGVTEEDFPTLEVPSGETVEPKRRRPTQRQ
ncbi:glucose-1-phosphate adenylyltransferase subunit GlgD [Chloroflexota bacterium]